LGQDEKLLLQTNLASCEAVCTQMQGELARIKAEYDTLATTLGGAAAAAETAASSRKSKGRRN
jgi:hypothetical protein